MSLRLPFRESKDGHCLGVPENIRGDENPFFQQESIDYTVRWVSVFSS
jgi:hypothetical protein